MYKHVYIKFLNSAKINLFNNVKISINILSISIIYYPLVLLSISIILFYSITLFYLVNIIYVTLLFYKSISLFENRSHVGKSF